MRNNKYSPFKLAAFPDKIQSFRDGKITAPLYVRIKPTNICTESCSWCVYKSDRREPLVENSMPSIENTMHTDMVEHDQLPELKFWEIIDDLKAMGVKAVTLSGGGEPLLYPKIVPAMERMISADIKLSIITNGLLLSGERAAMLGNAAWVRVSMDYSTPEELEKFRRVAKASFEKRVANIEAFATTKSADCDLGVNFIVHRQNYQGLVGVAKFLKGIGVENVRFSPMYCQNFGSYHAPIAYEVAVQLKEIQSFTDDKFSVNSSYEIDSPTKSVHRPFPSCFYAQTVPVIGADQCVYFCHNHAYQERGKLGSIRDRSFRDLWFSEEARQRFASLNPSTNCTNMECANHIKVGFINDLVDSHVDPFV